VLEKRVLDSIGKYNHFLLTFGTESDKDGSC
jgi:hypothetical protein